MGLILDLFAREFYNSRKRVQNLGRDLLLKKGFKKSVLLNRTFTHLIVLLPPCVVFENI